MRRQIRAIEGPLAGAVFVLHGKAKFGRASDSDIQIVHDGVSRHHALVVEEDDGPPVLMDLSSNNGTFVGNRRVVRHRLSPGDEFRILRARFVYEEVQEPEFDDVGSAPVYAVKITSAETLRQTVDHWSLDLPAPTSKPPENHWNVPAALARPPTQERLVEAPGPERHAVVAQSEDGRPYQGDILADIMEYRSLRIRKLREDIIQTEKERFEGLGQSLMQPPSDSFEPDGQRLFARFKCKFPARIRHGGQTGDKTARAGVLDISAGGARVELLDAVLAEGDLAWLVIDLVVRERPRTIVFTSRVVRVDGAEVGLIFAGAPEWEIWRPKRRRARSRARSRAEE